MRIHQLVKTGLAMGVMLVSGGCAADTLVPHPAPAPSTALQDVLRGKPAQVSVAQPNTQRAEGARIQTCNLGGYRGPGKPLMIVDGEALPHPETLNLGPEQIESIEILRSSAAIAIYGHRAADGAILVRTKRP